MGITWEEAEVAAQKSKQIRMASECGPMHPLACGLNQGQGQGEETPKKLNLFALKAMLTMLYMTPE